ncbi:MAG: 4Fe-4S dicluster domain-containing protein [Methanoregula sp.]
MKKSPKETAATPDCIDVGGSIRQRQDDYSILRIRIPCGHVTAEQLPLLAKIAKKYGHGELHLTTRQGVEIPWVLSKNIPRAKKDLTSHGFTFGASGPRVRVITACPGNLVCRHGIIDAQEFGRELDSRYFGGEAPHKFKIAVSGCPNSCTKPRENDVGFAGMAEPGWNAPDCISCKKCLKICKERAITFVANKIKIDKRSCIQCGDCITVCPTKALVLKRSGLAVYAGGKMGRHPVLGHKIAEFVDTKTAFTLLDCCLEFYRREGKPRERLGETIQRVGLCTFKEEISVILQ